MRHKEEFSEKADKFRSIIENEKHIYIQMHNFPDHDAIAGAYGLKVFLYYFGVESTIIYDGLIARADLKKMVLHLDIEVHHCSEFEFKSSDRIVVVDGNKNNKNVTRLKGDQFAVIDHHQIMEDVDVEFADIRPELGASSTLVYYYLSHFRIPVPRNLATAFMVGLLIDTNKMTRSVSSCDLEVYYSLYFKCNIENTHSIVRNCIGYDDLEYYQRAIDSLRIERNFGFCFLKEGCNPGLLGIIGDFILSLAEVEFVVICADNSHIINFSLRNESSEWNAASIICDALKGTGFGGGHSDLAGGYVSEAGNFDEDEMFDKFTSILFRSA